MLTEKFKSKHDETILPLQYCELLREENKKGDGWIGCLGVNVNECRYKEK